MDYRWKKEYETGIPEIDKQHQNFFIILSKLYDVVPKNNNDEEISEIISELKSYSLYHFKTEEDLLEKYAYPEQEKIPHVEMHHKLCESIKEFEKNDTESLGIIGYKLAEFAREWLIDHILKTDMLYVAYIKKDYKI
jgi:hemerythrin